MSDWTLLTIAVVALLGGMGIALIFCRCRGEGTIPQPSLEAGTLVRLTVDGRQFKTLFHHRQGETLWLVPPLRSGLPVSFPQGTVGTLEAALPAGIYTASIQCTARCTNPSLIGLQLTSTWRYMQRRRYERTLVRGEAKVEIEYGGDRWIGWIQDISQGGMRLVSPVSVPEGALLLLRLPSTLTKSTPTERWARVVACQRTAHRTGYAYTVRLAYTDAPPSS